MKHVVSAKTGKVRRISLTAVDKAQQAADASDFAADRIIRQALTDTREARDVAIEKLLEIEGSKGAGDAAVKDYITKRDQKRTPK